MVSVIISTYNRREMLKEAVASVQGQTLRQWELLVVDDASTDDTWEWLSSLRDERIRVFRQEVNRERSAARNWGLAEARGDYAMFLDDDDRLLPDALRLLSGALSARPAAIAAVGGKSNFAPGKFSVRMPHTPVTVFREIWPEQVARWSAVPGQCLFRAEIVREVGGFRVEMNVCEDRQLWMDIALRGPTVVIPECVLEYRQHDGQWRPVGLDELRELVMRRFYVSLPERESARARRYLRCGELVGHQADSAMPYVRAFLLAPALFFSPLTGPAWWRGFAKALLPRALRPRSLWERNQPTGDPKQHPNSQDGS